MPADVGIDLQSAGPQYGAAGRPGDCFKRRGASVAADPTKVPTSGICGVNANGIGASVAAFRPPIKVALAWWRCRVPGGAAWINMAGCGGTRAIGPFPDGPPSVPRKDEPHTPARCRPDDWTDA